MTVTNTTRRAKCKDCKYIYPILFGMGKRKRFKCSNTESDRAKYVFSTVSPSDLVCEKWELIGAPDIKDESKP